MSSNKCPSCSKSVYKVEEILCAGGAWHKECFKCGGFGDLGCQRKLNLSDFKSHAAVPYCKGCYMQAITKPAVVVEEAAAAAVITGSEKTDLPNLNSSGKMSDRPISVSVGSKANLANRLACPKCTKTVYKAEEIQLAGFSWHKSCFTCGGASETDGCKRTLNAQDFHPHRGNPFCKGCIGKQTIGDKKKHDSSSITRSDTDSSESAAGRERVVDVSEPVTSKYGRVSEAPSPTSLTVDTNATPVVNIYKESPRLSTRSEFPKESPRLSTRGEFPKESPRLGSKGDVYKESPRASFISQAEQVNSGATTASAGNIASSARDAAPTEAPAVPAATVPVVSTSAPVVAIASPATSPTIATVVAVDGRPKDGEREENVEIEEGETSYVDGDGVPCTKDGEPLTVLDSVTLNSESGTRHGGPKVFDLLLLG